MENLKQKDLDKRDKFLTKKEKWFDAYEERLRMMGKELDGLIDEYSKKNNKSLVTKVHRLFDDYGQQTGIAIDGALLATLIKQHITTIK